MEINKLIDRSASILIQPRMYFESDEDALDFSDGAVYVAIMAIVGAVVGTILGTQQFGESVGWLIGIVVAPIAGVLTAFITAGIIHIVCAFLGSRQDFGSSFGIAAAAGALYPVTAIIYLVPGIGVLIGFVWSWWIISEGATVIHRVDRGSSRIVFGVLYGLLALAGLIA